ncbi:hypothetical protein D3C73_1640680 [compost metagenome]
MVVDFTHSHVWDQSAVAAIAKIIGKYEALGKRVTITGLNEESTQMVARVGLTLTGGHS